MCPRCHRSNPIPPIIWAGNAQSLPDCWFYSEPFNNAFSVGTQNCKDYFLFASATERKMLVLNLLIAQTALRGKNILKDSEGTSPLENTGFCFVPETFQGWYFQTKPSKVTAHTPSRSIVLLQQRALRKHTSNWRRDLIRLEE